MGRIFVYAYAALAVLFIATIIFLVANGENPIVQVAMLGMALSGLYNSIRGRR